MLPVASWSCVARPTLITQQLSVLTQVAGWTEATMGPKMKLLRLLLKFLMSLVALSQCGKRQEEEEKTEAS